MIDKMFVGGEYHSAKKVYDDINNSIGAALIIYKESLKPTIGKTKSHR